MRGITCLICAWTATAAADPASDLFTEGLVLKAEGKVDRACAKLEESFRLARAPVTMVELGECAERAGELRRALAFYETAEHDLAAIGSERHARYAHNRAADVRDRIAPVTEELPARQSPQTPPANHTLSLGAQVVVTAGVFAAGYGFGKAIIAYEVERPSYLDAARRAPTEEDYHFASSGAADARRSAFIHAGIGLVGVATVVGVVLHARSHEARPSAVTVVPSRGGAG